MKYVIIGDSAAAVGCIEGIRRLDQKGKIVVVTDEEYPVYSRPLISYFLCGKTDREHMKYRPDDFYEKNGVDLYCRTCAVKIDETKKEVLMSDGTKMEYDKLLIATGSAPFMPSMQGLEQVKRKFTFMSLDDALVLEKSLSEIQNVLIIGAGLIGLKCAEGIYERVGRISVVDMADRILPSILDGDAAGMVQQHLEDKGIRFYLSDSVAYFEEKQAVLKSGRKIPFDAVVVAVGVRPNISLTEGTGIQTGRGIVTDVYGRTTAADIYAAGDCAQSMDAVTRTERVLALLPNAYMQGECAGIHMAGGEKPYDFAIAMNAIGFFGLHMMTAGSYEGEALAEKTAEGYKKLVVKDGRLVGFILVGDIRRGGIYTYLIRNRIPIQTLDFDVLAAQPQLLAFSKEKRKELLGGVPR